MRRPALKPGPVPRSCLTCRQRRKKCDLSRPYCSRCLKGGYKCLGYENGEPCERVCQEDPTVSSSSQLRPISPVVPAEGVKSEILDFVVVGASEDRRGPSNADTSYNPKPSVLGAALLYRMNTATYSADDDCVAADSPKDFDRLWPQESSQLTVYSHPRIRQSSCARRDLDANSNVRSTGSGLSKSIEDLCQSIPPSVDARQVMREDYLVQVIHEFHSQRASYWFMTPPPAIRSSMVTHHKGSKKIVWTKYLGAKLFRLLGQNQAHGSNIQEYIGWLDKLEHKFITGSHSNSSLSDVGDCLMIQLELAFFKFIIVDSVSGYTLLRRAVPRFLQLIAADTNLHTEHQYGNLLVSFPRTLCAPRFELRWFIVYDAVVALVLGVPPLVEYGYDGECDSSSYGFEWVHGMPVALLQAISQINTWRASSKVAPDDWQALERRVLAWKPSSAVLDQVSATESTSVVRVAVQETWQHVVLIYIYMGICRVSSHDSRVQSSVHRIIQLGQSLANLPIGVHMFIHCIVAGVAARLEKHRLLVHQMLLSFKDTRVWLFRGPQFGQVLYHLWHGVGAGGAPVTWDDYVQSRCTVVPI